MTESQVIKVLIVTNMLPTVNNPSSGTFVGQQIESLRNKEFALDVIHLDRKQYGMSIYAKTVQLVSNSIKNFKPDLVHTMYGGVLGWQVSKISIECPIIQSFCGTDIQGVDAGNILLRLRSRIGIYYSRRTLPKVEHLILKAKRMLTYLPEWYPRNRVSIIPNGINSKLFFRRDSNQCRDILGWEQDKFHVVLASPTENDLNKRVELARRATEHLPQELKAQFHLISNIEHQQVPIWLNAANVVLMTSLKEGSPNIVKEALACKVPIVSVDVGDVKELIDGIEGCYISKDTVHDLAAALQKVALYDKEIDSDSIVRTLDINNIADQIRALYIDVLNRKR